VLGQALQQPVRSSRAETRSVRQRMRVILRKAGNHHAPRRRALLPTRSTRSREPIPNTITIPRTRSHGKMPARWASFPIVMLPMNLRRRRQRLKNSFHSLEMKWLDRGIM
jgi:hypothetical protein